MWLVAIHMRVVLQTAHSLHPSDRSQLTAYRCFHDWGVMEFWIIFKATTGSSGYAFWWERTTLHSWRRLFDACLVALKSVSPGQRIYYGMLRCHTLPSKENFSSQRLPPWFFATDFSLTRTVPHFSSQQGAWPELPVTAIICILSKFHHTSIVKASIFSRQEPNYNLHSPNPTVCIFQTGAKL